MPQITETEDGLRTENQPVVESMRIEGQAALDVYVQGIESNIDAIKAQLANLAKAIDEMKRNINDRKR